MTLPLFSLPEPPQPSTRGMVRRSSPETSVLAAESVAPHRSALQERVLKAFQHLGPMTDAELEALVQFCDLGPSTIRKRRSELYQRGDLVKVGTRRNTRGRFMDVWDVKK